MNKKFLKVSIGIFYRFDDKGPSVFLQRRKDEGALKNMLEFPGGKIEEGETPSQALVREVREETGVLIDERDAILFKLRPFEYPLTKVLLYTFLIKKDVDLKTWYPLDQYQTFKSETPEANDEIFRDLKAFFGSSLDSFRDFEAALWP